MVLQPGENILTHTLEFIGGNQRIGTSMQARSSLGRSHVSVCRCAGWGDPGYVNRWTMEVTNNSEHHPIILVVGRRVAQIVFWEVAPVSESYGGSGKYQSGGDIDEIMRNWQPEAMLPRLYLDREVRKTARALGDQIESREDSGIHYAFPPRTRAGEDYRTYGKKAAGAMYIFNTWGLLPAETERIRKMLTAGGLAETVAEI